MLTIYTYRYITTHISTILNIIDSELSFFFFTSRETQRANTYFIVCVISIWRYKCIYICIYVYIYIYMQLNWKAQIFKNQERLWPGTKHCTELLFGCFPSHYWILLFYCTWIHSKWIFFSNGNENYLLIWYYWDSHITIWHVSNRYWSLWIFW